MLWNYHGFESSNTWKSKKIYIIINAFPQMWKKYFSERRFARWEIILCVSIRCAMWPGGRLAWRWRPCPLRSLRSRSSNSSRSRVFRFNADITELALYQKTKWAEANPWGVSICWLPFLYKNIRIVILIIIYLCDKITKNKL